MKNHNTYTVHGWMINELKLKGNELALYAIIYGFSHDGKTKFWGSIKYLSYWLGGVDRKTVISLKRSLINKGLIIEIPEPEGNKFQVVAEKFIMFTLGGGETPLGGVKTPLGGWRNSTRGSGEIPLVSSGKIPLVSSGKIPPINNNNNNNYNNSNIESTSQFEVKKNLLKISPQDSIENRMAAWKIYEQFSETDDFKHQWDFLADTIKTKKVAPKKVLKAWVTGADWYLVRNMRINKMKNWIAKESQIQESAPKKVRDDDAQKEAQKIAIKNLLGNV